MQISTCLAVLGVFRCVRTVGIRTSHWQRRMMCSADSKSGQNGGDFCSIKRPPFT